MDYKQKYEEALEKARVWKEKSGMPIDRQGILDDIFPELKESEDERIRKALIYYFSEQDGILTAINGSVSVRDILAWLEKQGEKKPYGQRKECLDCQFNYAGECKGSCQMKRDEQKLAWSEEDEKMLKSVISSIRISRSSCEEDDDVRDLFDNEIDWLESLKERIKET